MIRILCIIVTGIMLVSCEEKKTEFIQSGVYKNLYLVKNLPGEASAAKKIIQDFVIKSSLKDDVEFYKYTNNTKYFLDHKEDPGGFSSEELGRYQEEEGIASFENVKCEKDTLKKVGVLRYYNEKYGNFYRPDTLINNCK